MRRVGHDPARAGRRRDGEPFLVRARRLVRSFVASSGEFFVAVADLFFAVVGGRYGDGERAASLSGVGKVGWRLDGLPIDLSVPVSRPLFPQFPRARLVRHSGPG